MVEDEWLLFHEKMDNPERFLKNKEKKALVYWKTENVLTKASTVGFPRESIISCAKTFSILFLFFILPLTCRICGIYQSVVQFVTIIYPYSDFIPYMNKKRRQIQYPRIGEDIAKKRQKQKCITADFPGRRSEKAHLPRAFNVSKLLILFLYIFHRRVYLNLHFHCNKNQIHKTILSLPLPNSHKSLPR